MTNNPERQQPDTTSASSPSSRAGTKERNDLIGRTSLPLPSLSGLEQLPPVSASEQTEKDLVLPESNQEESLLFLAELSTIPQSPVDIADEPTQPVRLATAPAAMSSIELAGPDDPTQPLFVPLEADEPTQPVQLAAILPAGPGAPVQPLPSDQPAGQPHTAIKRIRLRTLLLIGAACLLAGGGLWYAVAHVMALVTISTPGQNQGGAGQKQAAVMQPMSRSFLVGSAPTITIQGHTGMVHIVAGGSRTVIVKTSGNQGAASASNGISYYQARDAQGRTVLSIIAGPAAGDVTYDVTMPPAARVQIALDSATIAVDGISGGTITITNGSMDIEHISGPLRASTKNGDITVRYVTGRMVVQTENGSIRASDITGPLQAMTRNGDVNVLRGALSGQSLLKTVYGSVSFAGTLNRQGNYTLETSRGNVTLTLPPNAAFQLHTHIGSGNVHNAFGKNAQGTPPRSQLTISVDSGSIYTNRATA